MTKQNNPSFIVILCDRQRSISREEKTKKKQKLNKELRSDLVKMNRKERVKFKFLLNKPEEKFVKSKEKVLRIFLV